MGLMCLKCLHSFRPLEIMCANLKKRRCKQVNNSAEQVVNCHCIDYCTMKFKHGSMVRLKHFVPIMGFYTTRALHNM